MARVSDVASGWALVRRVLGFVFSWLERLALYLETLQNLQAWEGLHCVEERQALSSWFGDSTCPCSSSSQHETASKA